MTRDENDAGASEGVVAFPAGPRGNDWQAVGRLVAQRRGALGLTRADLAKRAGVDEKTVYNLEVAGRRPHARTRAALAAELSLTEADFDAVAGGRQATSLLAHMSTQDLLAELARRLDTAPLLPGATSRDVDRLLEEVEEAEPPADLHERAAARLRPGAKKPGPSAPRS